MVLLHMKRSEQDQFLVEIPAQTLVKDAVRELSLVHNLRHRIHRLKLEGEELAKYGPAKHPDKQGIDQYSEEPVEKGPHYNMDPTGRRTGNACDPQTAQVLLDTLQEADAAASKDKVAAKVALTQQMLEGEVDKIRGAVMITYPMGLPEWDLVRLALEDKEELQGTQYAADVMEPEAAVLWFAGKQLQADKKLADYMGRNERTRAVVKLQRKGQGAPAREPVVDAETQKAMLAYYYKKQEAQKKLSENDDDTHISSSWANPKTLKQQFTGLSSIKVPR